jgi:hypothetical protein
MRSVLLQTTEIKGWIRNACSLYVISENAVTPLQIQPGEERMTMRTR